MNHEVFTIPTYETEKSPIRLTRRGKLAAWATGIALAATAGYGVSEHQSAEMHGSQSITVEPGDVLDNLINTHVEHGASYTGEVRTETLNDPDNADVFENGQLDPGEVVELPKSVQG